MPNSGIKVVIREDNNRIASNQNEHGEHYFADLTHSPPGISLSSISVWGGDHHIRHHHGTSSARSLLGHHTCRDPGHGAHGIDRPDDLCDVHNLGHGHSLA